MPTRPSRAERSSRRDSDGSREVATVHKVVIGGLSGGEEATAGQLGRCDPDQEVAGGPGAGGGGGRRGTGRGGGGGSRPPPGRHPPPPPRGGGGPGAPPR